MNPDILEKVMSCRKLPSLPAVAMRVVELTQSDTVSMKDLADTIQNDQALAAKILRTVNSSLFGLRQKCSTINQAIIMLGLSAVKSLALGFSLVSAIKDSAEDGFDMNDHWRRALYSGVAAKAIAAQAGIGNQEECFLGGLLQDVGMVALHQTLGADYAAIIAESGGDHKKVAKLELDALQLQHPDLGAMLAKRWKLPEELVMPIKYHERPTAAPGHLASICRAVGLGNVAAEVLTSAEPAEPLRRFYLRAEQWFALDNGRADAVLKSIGQATREVARFLSVATGPVADAEAVLTTAREQLANMTIPASEDIEATSINPASATDPSAVDELTGVASRQRLDQTLIAAFEQARTGVGTLSVALIDLDGLGRMNDDYGREAGDTALIVSAVRIDRAMRPREVLVGRFDGGRFAVIMPRTGREEAVRAVEAARAAIAAEAIELIAAKRGAPPSIMVTTSVGLACIDETTLDRFEDVNALMAIIEQAVRAAKKAGRNTVRVYAPSRPAAAAAA